MANLDGDDIIFCQITSRAKIDKYSINLEVTDFISGSLTVLSVVRPNKIFTADESIISYAACRISQEKTNSIIKSIDFEPTFISTRTAFSVVLKNMNYDLHGSTTQVSTQVNTQVNTQVERAGLLLEFCAEPRTRDEMQQFVGMTNREYFRKKIIKPLLDNGSLKMTIPDKPNSQKQKYVKA